MGLPVSATYDSTDKQLDPTRGVSVTGEIAPYFEAFGSTVGSSGAFESVRRSLGVDSLDVTTGASGGPAVGASRYISDRVRLGVRAGASPEESGVSVDVDIPRRFKAKTDVGADGSTSVGAGYECEW